MMCLRRDRSIFKFFKFFLKFNLAQEEIKRKKGRGERAREREREKIYFAVCLALAVCAVVIPKSETHA